MLVGETPAILAASPRVDRAAGSDCNAVVSPCSHSTYTLALQRLDKLWRELFLVVPMPKPMGISELNVIAELTVSAGPLRHEGGNV